MSYAAGIEPSPGGASAGGSKSGPTATAQYDYEAAGKHQGVRLNLDIADGHAIEDNEISFPEHATITNLEFPDEDWWLGTFQGKTGLCKFYKPSAYDRY